MGRLTRHAENRWARRRVTLPQPPPPARRDAAVPQAAPGWYPHPEMIDTQRYWDGGAWTDHIAPIGSKSARGEGGTSGSQAYVVLVLAGAAIGLIMAMQSASLLTGTSTQWTGVAIAVAAGIVSRVVRGSIPKWVRVVAVLAALVAFANVLYLENQLDERRQEIQQILP